jgi:hypothetical protein
MCSHSRGGSDVGITVVFGLVCTGAGDAAASAADVARTAARLPPWRGSLAAHSRGARSRIHALHTHLHTRARACARAHARTHTPAAAKGHPRRSRCSPPRLCGSTVHHIAQCIGVRPTRAAMAKGQWGSAWPAMIAHRCCRLQGGDGELGREACRHRGWCASLTVSSCPQ